MTSLEKISSENYLFSLGSGLPLKAMRKVILNTQECKNIIKDIKQKKITDKLIKKYIQKLSSNFKTGERFFYELTLATLAVCYENCNTEFAKEFITDLSLLKVAELSYSSRIAKECLKYRFKNV